MTNLDKALKLRVGSFVPEELTKLILQECSNTSLQSLASKCSKLKLAKVAIGGRTRKYVCFWHKGKAIPITKSRLYAKARKRPCKHCGELICKRSQVLKAFRDTIAPQIKEFKDSTHQLQTRCAISNCPLALCPGGWHVDHVYPFSKLVEDFMLEQELELCHIPLSGRGQKKKLPTFIAESWSQYHKDKAVLQGLCKRQNLKKSASIQ